MNDGILIFSKVLFLLAVLAPSLLLVTNLERIMVTLYSGGGVKAKSKGVKRFAASFFHSLGKDLSWIETGSKLKLIFFPIIHLGVCFVPLGVLAFCEPIVFNREILKSEIYTGSNGLYVFMALVEAGVLTHILVGWSINNNLSILGNLKKVMQFFSVELLFVLVIINLSITFQASDLHQINNIQNRVLFRSFDLNGLYLQPVMALAYFYYITVKSLYLKNMFSFELSGTRFSLGFYTNSLSLMFSSMAERIHTFCHAVIFAHLFLGGYDVLPGTSLVIENFPNSLYIVQIVSILLKAIFIHSVASSIKWLIPKLRSDQLLDKAWKYWTPLILVNTLLSYLYLLAKELQWV
jgi:NADH:ubiquinone oxidoreductase subunit H